MVDATAPARLRDSPQSMRSLPRALIESRHPDEARWARDLRMLIERRTAERSSSNQTSQATGEHRSVEARIVDRLQQRRQQVDPATGAVLRRVKTNAPVHRPRPPRREGPSLGR